MKVPQRQSESEDARAPPSMAEMMENNFSKLPDIDQKIFVYGPFYLAGNAGLGGLVANSLYRRLLNVTHARFSSSLAMAGMPFIITLAMYNISVSVPLLTAELNCASCTMTRGAVVGAIGGAVYPLILAAPLNMGLAVKYGTTPLPEKGNVMRHWWVMSKPILRKMRAVVLLQAFFGVFLSNRNFDTYTKLVQMSLRTAFEQDEE